MNFINLKNIIGNQSKICELPTGCYTWTHTHQWIQQGSAHLLPQLHIKICTRVFFFQKLNVLKLVPFTHSQKLKAYGNATYDEKEVRMQEIVESIENTLTHPEVGQVYIFYQDSLLIPYMEKQNFKNQEKLVFVPNMEDTMATLFRYANEHVEGHVVMVMNADVYPLDGFEQIDFQYLRSNKVLYALSRFVVAIKSFTEHSRTMLGFTNF